MQPVQVMCAFGCLWCTQARSLTCCPFCSLVLAWQARQSRKEEHTHNAAALVRNRVAYGLFEAY